MAGLLDFLFQGQGGSGLLGMPQQPAQQMPPAGLWHRLYEYDTGGTAAARSAFQALYNQIAKPAGVFSDGHMTGADQSRNSNHGHDALCGAFLRRG
jgi:hypothetical protein